jgi:hypothetical protein
VIEELTYIRAKDGVKIGNEGRKDRKSCADHGANLKAEMTAAKYIT